VSRPLASKEACGIIFVGYRTIMRTAYDQKGNLCSFDSQPFPMAGRVPVYCSYVLA